MKPANVLLSFRGDVKIGDLGVSCVERSPASKLFGTLRDDSRTDLSESDVSGRGAPTPRSPPTPSSLGTEGTLAFFSPERAAGGHYGVAADVWALGVALVAVSTGAPPYSAFGGLFEFEARLSAAPTPRLRSESATAVALVASMLAKRASDRPTAASLLKRDPFLVSSEPASEDRDARRRTLERERETRASRPTTTGTPSASTGRTRCE